MNGIGGYLFSSIREGISQMVISILIYFNINPKVV